MAGLGTTATTAIITKGLTCGQGGTAACRSGIITTHFSLYCTGIRPKEEGVGGGGPYPGDAWNKISAGELDNFWKPVDNINQPPYIVPRDKESEYFRRYNHVVLRFKMGNFEVEKEYAVPESRAKTIVKVLNVANVTFEKIAVSVKSIKQLATKMVVTISKVRLRRTDK